MQETKYLDITKILRYAPKGLPLYSPVCGECYLDSYTDEMVIVFNKADYFSFHKNGQYYENQGECLLFPSKDHRMWDGWQKILLPQSIGSVCCTNEPEPQSKLYLCDSKGPINIKGNYYDFWKEIPTRSIELLGYASPEETEQFFTMLKSWDREWDGKKIVKKQCNEQRWRDNTNAKINGFYIGMHTSEIHYLPTRLNTPLNYNVFATKKQAKSALAMARISQIMVHDKRFGGVVTDEEWRSGMLIATIDRINNVPRQNLNSRLYNFLAFHTEEQRDLFLKENEDLVKDYLMISDD